MKGITGTGKEAGALQVTKYVAPRMRELKTTEIQGLAVVNHQRNLAPRDRQAQAFQRDVLTNAEEQQFGLLTGVDLFRLVRNAERLSWTHNDVADLLYRAGRIDPVPSHYTFIGTVDGYWEQVPAVGLQVEADSLRPGDRLAFELPIDFVEQNVDSIQMDNAEIEEALCWPAGCDQHFSLEEGSAERCSGLQSQPHRLTEHSREQADDEDANKSCTRLSNRAPVMRMR